MRKVDVIEPAEARRIREAAGLSQAGLAALVGVSQLSILRWELGQTSPRPLQAQAWYSTLRRLERWQANPVP